MLHFEQANDHFPTGGWGFFWTGDPGAATARNSPAHGSIPSCRNWSRWRFINSAATAIRIPGRPSSLRHGATDANTAGNDELPFAATSTRLPHWVGLWEREHVCGVRLQPGGFVSPRRLCGLCGRSVLRRVRRRPSRPATAAGLTRPTVGRLCCLIRRNGPRALLFAERGEDSRHHRRHQQHLYARGGAPRRQLLQRPRTQVADNESMYSGFRQRHLTGPTYFSHIRRSPLPRAMRDALGLLQTILLPSSAVPPCVLAATWRSAMDRSNGISYTIKHRGPPPPGQSHRWLANRRKGVLIRRPHGQRALDQLAVAKSLMERYCRRRRRSAFRAFRPLNA